MSNMRDIKEIEDAAERASEMQSNAEQNGSKYPGMKYEDGLREAFDWITGNSDEDPTRG